MKEYIYGDGSEAPATEITAIIDHPSPRPDGATERNEMLRRKSARAAKNGDVATALYLQSKIGE